MGRKGLIFSLFLLSILPLYAEENLIFNGDFEEGRDFPYGWGSKVKVYPGIRVLPSDPRYPGGKVKEGENILWVEREGGRCILFVMDEPAPPYASISETTGITYASDLIELVPGKRYRLEVEAKSTGPEGIVFLKGYGKLEDGTYQERYRAPLHLHFLKEINKWKKFSRTFYIPFPEVRWGIISLYAYGRRGKIWWDRVSLYPEE